MQTRRLFVLLAAVLLVVAGVVARPYLGALARKVGVGRVSPEMNREDAPLDRSHSSRPSGYDAALDKAQTIVFLGDSRIEWGAWSEMLGRGDISNRGISGDTTAGILQRVRSAVPDAGGVCVIQAGVNDLSLGVAPDQVLTNYHSILKYLREEKRTHVIVTSIILVSQDRSDLNRAIDDCNRGLAELASSTGANWLDLNAVLSPQNYLATEYSDDGVHLNAHGYEQVCRALAPHLPAESAS